MPREAATLAWRLTSPLASFRTPMTRSTVLEFASLFRPPEALRAIRDPAEVSRLYAHWRMRTMYAMFIGYAVFYFVRKNLSAATPAIIAELGYSKTQIGLLWSGLYLAYGLSKLANGVLGEPRERALLHGDRSLSLGARKPLLRTELVDHRARLFWVLNGWAQGMGWPPCARLLTAWYGKSERGTKWALWNTSHQVGGGLILLLAGWLTEHFGWRASFVVPAAIALACSFFLVNRLRDTPESLGLPSIEKFRGEEAAATGTTPLREGLGHLLRSRQLWFLALANFFVYLVRYGAMDWAPTFLVEVQTLQPHGGVGQHGHVRAAGNRWSGAGRPAVGHLVPLTPLPGERRLHAGARLRRRGVLAHAARPTPGSMAWP